MRKRALAAACAVLPFCFAERGAAQDSGTQADLDRAKQVLTDRIEENTTGAAAHEMNGFRVESGETAELGANLRPSGNRFQLLSVTGDGMFNVTIEKGRPMSTGGGLGIFHRESGTPMLSAADADGDGRIDVLTYAVLDENGKAVLDVVDYEADGQPDMRLHFKDGYSEIWHAERWHRIEAREGRRGIVVDGAFVELQRRDNRFIVP